MEAPQSNRQIFSPSLSDGNSPLSLSLSSISSTSYILFMMLSRYRKLLFSTRSYAEDAHVYLCVYTLARGVCTRRRSLRSVGTERCRCLVSSGGNLYGPTRRQCGTSRVQIHPRLALSRSLSLYIYTDNSICIQTYTGSTVTVWLKIIAEGSLSVKLLRSISRYVSRPLLSFFQASAKIYTLTWI